MFGTNDANARGGSQHDDGKQERDGMEMDGWQGDGIGMEEVDGMKEMAWKEGGGGREHGWRMRRTKHVQGKRVEGKENEKREMEKEGTRATLGDGWRKTTNERENKEGRERVRGSARKTATRRWPRKEGERVEDGWKGA